MPKIVKNKEKLNAKHWQDKHTEIIEKLIKQRLVTELTTPKGLAEMDENFKSKIYDKFQYGTVNNKLKKLKSSKLGGK
jgi:hypothetical protein